MYRLKSLTLISNIMNEMLINVNKNKEKTTMFIGVNIVVKPYAY